MNIKPKRLVQKAGSWKWQKMAAQYERKVTQTEAVKRVASKGHFVVYTMDGSRFEVPLKFLSTPIFEELFRMSEEEFGLPSNDDRLVLPCSCAFMECVLDLLRGHISVDVAERALLVATGSGDQCCSRSSQFQGVVPHNVCHAWLLN